ncbi:MAG TPA: hypothetical protein PKX12_14025 [Spirochaetota bacterium]|nr:hypothetical protein [Spirochaetota bacterium]
MDIPKFHETFNPILDVLQDRDLLNGEPGKYKYTIYVSGENVKPASIKIISQWDGSWDNYKVYLAD